MMHDPITVLCIYHHGPWWHRACYHSLLTGKYYTSGGSRSSPPYGVNWYHWRNSIYSLRVADMKIRPGGVYVADKAHRLSAIFYV